MPTRHIWPVSRSPSPAWPRASCWPASSATAARTTTTPPPTCRCCGRGNEPVTAVESLGPQHPVAQVRHVAVLQPADEFQLDVSGLGGAEEPAAGAQEHRNEMDSQL